MDQLSSLLQHYTIKSPKQTLATELVQHQYNQTHTMDQQLSSFDPLSGSQSDDLFLTVPEDTIKPAEPTLSPSPVTQEKRPDITALKAIAYRLQGDVATLIRALEGKEYKTQSTHTQQPTQIHTVAHLPYQDHTVIEGVFNGTQMVGPDGKEYPVPPNYASKSKLVEGDMMKLTILPDGKLIFKQIGPIVRKHVKGSLQQDVNGQWYVSVPDGRYNVLTASVTFYKGKTGDEVSLIIPEDGSSTWGAVDTILNM